MTDGRQRASKRQRRQQKASIHTDSSQKANDEKKATLPASQNRTEQTDEQTDREAHTGPRWW
jgi:hypothetical protein